MSYDEIRDELINASNAFDAALDQDEDQRKAARKRFEAAQAAHSAWLEEEARKLASQLGHELTITLTPQAMAHLIAYTNYLNHLSDKLGASRYDLSGLAAAVLTEVLEKRIRMALKQLHAEMAFLDQERDELLKMKAEEFYDPGIYYDILADIEANEADFESVEAELNALEVK